jgi:hypothetical protein
MTEPITDDELKEYIKKYDKKLAHINDLKLFSQKFHGFTNQIGDTVFSKVGTLPHICNIDKKSFTTHWYRDISMKLNYCIQMLEMDCQNHMNTIMKLISNKMNSCCIDIISQDTSITNKDSIIDFLKKT